MNRLGSVSNLRSAEQTSDRCQRMTGEWLSWRRTRWLSLEDGGGRVYCSPSCRKGSPTTVELCWLGRTAILVNAAVACSIFAVPWIFKPLNWHGHMGEILPTSGS